MRRLLAPLRFYRLLYEVPAVLVGGVLGGICAVVPTTTLFSLKVVDVEIRARLHLFIGKFSKSFFGRTIFSIFVFSVRVSDFSIPQACICLFRVV